MIWYKIYKGIYRPIPLKMYGIAIELSCTVKHSPGRMRKREIAKIGQFWPKSKPNFDEK